MKRLINKFAPTTLSVACAQAIAVLTLSTQPVFGAESAQYKAGEDLDTLLEEVEVLGIRKTLRQSIDHKRDAENIVDAIVASDVGKMPDKNIAEALQRVAGVSINRDKGEGTTITIRGLGDSLNNTLINGQTVASAGAGRGIDFSSMPSSMISAIEVHKTPSAKHLEGSIGGTVNIVTARPLDVGSAKGSVFIEGALTENNEESSPSINLSYMTPITDTFGVAVGFSQEDISSRTDSVSNWSWAESENGYYPTRWGVSAQERERERSSVLVNFQWQPSDNIDTYLDVTYTQVEDSLLEHAFTSWIPYGDSAIVPGSIVTNPNTNTMTEFAVDNLYISPSDESVEADIDTLTLQLGGDIVLGNLTLSTAVGYSKAETEELTQQIYNFDHWYLNGDQHDALFRMQGDRQYGYLPSGSEFYDPSIANNHSEETFEDHGFNLNRLSQGPIMRLPVANTDEDVSFKFDADYVLDGNEFFSSVEAGIRWNKRSKETHDASQHLGPWEIQFDDYNSGFSLWGAEPLFHDANSERFEPVNFLGGNANAGVPTGWNSIRDFDLAITSYTAHMNRLFGFVDDGSTPYFTTFDSVFDITGLTPDRRGNANNEEETASAYFQANLNMMDGQLTGNVGLRYVNTELTSSALVGGAYEATHGGELSLISLSHDYSNVLPSINLNYRINDEMVFRFAAATVMARPDFDQAKAGASTTTDGWLDLDGSEDPNWSVADEDRFEGGNVFLDPYEANQFDLSFEYYFSKNGMVSVGAFYKDISSFIFNAVELGRVSVPGYETELDDRAPFYTEADFLGGETQLDVAVEYPLYFESVARSINGDGGKISGLELGVVSNLDFIEGMENFGFQANYTYANSKADYFKESFGDDGVDLPYQYQSEHTYNLMAFYEDNNMMFRLAYNWRSESLEDPANDLDGMAIWRDSYGQLDGSFSYAFSDSIALIGSVSNLLEEGTQYFSSQRSAGNLLDGDDVPTDRNYNQTYNGRTFRLGLRVEF